jgi:FkbM family methyltransferase
MRSLLTLALGSIPAFRGKGRITLLLDKVLTDPCDPRSYEVTGYLNDGVRFNFDLRPWGQNFAYYYRDWEGQHINALRRLYSGGIFLDVGSSLGLYVVCMGNAVRSLGGSIISVEPVPFNLQRQKKNVALNHLEDLVTYVECALGSERASVRIKTDPLEADNNAFIAAEGGVEIVVVPLDDLIVENDWGRIGTIKMDVEGYEPMVIEGARETIERDRPVILAEFCRERMDINRFSVETTWSFLVGDLDYRCFWLNLSDKKLHSVESAGDLENLFFLPNDAVIAKDLFE